MFNLTQPVYVVEALQPPGLPPRPEVDVRLAHAPPVGPEVDEAPDEVVAVVVALHLLINEDVVSRVHKNCSML